jgi:hypothetical protein
MIVKIIEGLYKDKFGTILARIPGDRYYRVKLDDGTGIVALHETEFLRLPKYEFAKGDSRSITEVGIMNDCVIFYILIRNTINIT